LVWLFEIGATFCCSSRKRQGLAIGYNVPGVSTTGAKSCIVAHRQISKLRQERYYLNMSLLTELVSQPNLELQICRAAGALKIPAQ
jgi:hypothetical protein